MAVSFASHSPYGFFAAGPAAFNLALALAFDFGAGMSKDKAAEPAEFEYVVSRSVSAFNNAMSS